MSGIQANAETVGFDAVHLARKRHGRGHGLGPTSGPGPSFGGASRSAGQALFRRRCESAALWSGVQLFGRDGHTHEPGRRRIGIGATGRQMAKASALWAYTIAGWSGFYVMLVELLSGRLIAPSFGSSIYVWGSVIFVFMLGLAIGYLLGGIYSQHHPSVLRLCGILMASALSTVPTLLFGTLILDFMFDAVRDPRFGSLVTCLALFLVPTIFAGMVSPYTIRIIVKNKESSGHDAGYLYFISTIGSSLGTLLTAFYLVLLFEVNTIFLVGISISLLLGGLGALANYGKE